MRCFRNLIGDPALFRVVLTYAMFAGPGSLVRAQNADLV